MINYMCCSKHFQLRSDHRRSFILRIRWLLCQASPLKSGIHIRRKKDTLPLIPYSYHLNLFLSLSLFLYFNLKNFHYLTISHFDFFFWFLSRLVQTENGNWNQKNHSHFGIFYNIVYAMKLLCVLYQMQRIFALRS